MKLHAKTQPKLSVLAMCVISACVLSACGGGGSSGIVRTSPPPAPPPPPPSAEKFCPPPVTSNCVVDPPYTLAFNENQMSDGRQSDYALLMRSTSEGFLTLFGTYRFSGGTTIESGTLIVDSSTVLLSNTAVSSRGELWLRGIVRGNLTNDGRVLVGQTKLDPQSWDIDTGSRIEGNYQQSTTGTLSFTLGLPLQITGQAQLNGGTAELRGQRTQTGTYLLPNMPSSQQLLHANGGVSGQFTNWTSPGLFIEGSLRYAPNDVFFDLTRISLLGVMSAARPSDAITLETAGNIDSAFNAADAFAGLPAAALTANQRQFLQSAASIQNIDGYDQAATTFDSLSGHGHVAAVDALLQQATSSGSRVSAHASSLQPGAPAGRWSARAATDSTAVGRFTHAQTSGYDQWLTDRVVLGSSVGWSQGNLQFDRSGGNARSQSPQWNVYLRGNGDNGAYAMGEFGYGRHQLSLDRPIDLGNGKRNVHSERTLDATHAYAEAGRDLRVGNGRLTPFAALGYATVRGDGFIEQGSTGFELVTQASLHRRISGEAGVRYARNWRWGTDRWMQLDLGARYQHRLAASDEMRAAFTGTPGVAFDLNGLSNEHDEHWLEMNLAGGSRDRWSWRLSYDNRATTNAASLGLELGF